MNLTIKDHPMHDVSILAMASLSKVNNLLRPYFKKRNVIKDKSDVTIRLGCYKTFFMLNSAEHEIYPAH